MTPTTDELFNESVATLGDRLEAARLAKGMTVEDLSERLGVKTKTLEKWEKDADTPRANRLQMLASLLDVSIVWLISGEGNGTYNVADNYDRGRELNAILAEVTKLKATLSSTLGKLEELEGKIKDIA